MSARLTVLLGTILTALLITRCDHQVQYRQVPFPVQRHLQHLASWQSPKKIEIDYCQRRIYWLNDQGEIWAIRANGSEEMLINRGIGAHLGITYISDFSIDDQNGILYFTDLMDITTGLGAIKKSDLGGNQIETLATFSDESPYAVQWDKITKQLYYATQQRDTRLHAWYRWGESLPFVTTTNKVDGLAKLASIPAASTEIPLVAER